MEDKNNIIKLVVPSNDYKDQVMKYREIFLEKGESFDGCAGLQECESYEEWIDFENRLSKKYKENYVPSTVFLGVREIDNKLIGIIDFRHKLTNFFFNYGGNIGYSVLPSERRKGYAKNMLGLMLEYCKEQGFHRVLVTCDKENIGSQKTIIANGGILNNEVTDDTGLSESGIIQRYWISLKKRFADKYVKKRVNKSEQKILAVNDNIFKGDIYFYNFIDVKEKMYVPNGNCMLDNNYKWLEFYNYNSKVKLTAFYNEKNEILEWYFDIAREIGKENGIPYEDDLYLDVVVTPKGEIMLLDEDELKDALDRMEITEKDFEDANREARELISKLRNKKDELKEFTDKYLKEMLK